MIEKYTLANGIPVFVVSTDASPVVTVQAWISRGSAYEKDSVAGISHFLEHALFKGTKRRKMGEIAQHIESRGGEINAFTSFEETAYYATLSSRHFEDGLDIITDAIQNPLFDADEMEREKEVILEEIRRAHDSPYKMVSTNLWGENFSGTPYGRPVLGFEKTVSKIDHKALRSYFNEHYHAGSSALFIVGDVDAGDALALAKKKLAKMKQGKNHKLPTSLKINQPKGPRIVTLGKDIKECHLQMAILAPQITDERIPALDLMCSTIGQGESSRLYQRLVKEKKLALDVHMGLVSTSRCGMATIGLAVAPENLEPAIKEIYATLSEVAEVGLEDPELERVKSSLESDVVAGKETVEGYARRLGYYHVHFGQPDYEKKYLEQILAVDAEETTYALRDFLKGKPTLSMVHPLSYNVNKESLKKALTILSTKSKKVAVEHAAPKKIEKAPAVYIAKAIHTLPIISLKFLFLGGGRLEPKGKYGVGQLFGRLWTSGTPNFKAVQMAHTLESLGASLHGFCGRNTSGLSVEFLSKHWQVVKPMLSEVLLSPTFPQDELDTERELILREILSEKDSPGQLCHQNFMKLMYPEHPYGRSAMGTTDDVKSITREDLKAFYESQIRREGMVVSTVGSFMTQAWVEELETFASKLHVGKKPPAHVGKITEPTKIRIKIEKKEPLSQSHVLAGFLGSSLAFDDRYALKILSSALAGQGGRLFIELRDKQSLAYTVSPMTSEGPERGIFAFYIGCAPHKVEQALSGIRKEIDKVLEKPLGEKELSRAKEFWLGRFELEMQRYSAQAMLFGLDEVYGLGYNHFDGVAQKIKALSAKDIMHAAQKYLVPNHAAISVVHSTELSESVVEKAWS